MSTNDILQLDILPRLRELLVEDNVPDLQVRNVRMRWPLIF